MKISIICVHNNKQQLETALLSSLEKLNIDYEMVLIDGSNGKYKSCAEALNYGARKSTGDILIFSHQDIFIKCEKELLKFACFIEEQKKGTIVGIAGAKDSMKTNIGNYTSGGNICINYIENITKPIEVSCIDECFFGMKRSTYNQHPFDEKICDNWHLYAVEQCLFHRNNGDKIYVFPFQIHHLSKGKINLKYMDGLVMLAKRYHKDFKYIWTTCYKVRCSVLYCKALRFIWLLNRKVRRKEY